jgi:hypothetical protein
MSHKTKDEIPQIGIKNAVDKPAGFNYIVSEGSIVIFDLHDFISDNDIDTDKMKFETCRQLYGKAAVNRHDENDRISFTAPYVQGDHVNTKLSFELIVKYYGNKIKDRSYNVSVIVKRVQRAIIFQGGVSLGAYEAGVFQALTEKLIKEV